MTIEKKRYLQNNYFFYTDDSLQQLRAKASSLKKHHIKSLKRRQNVVNKEHGKKGVFLLLDSDQRDKLDRILQARSISLHSFFADYIEDQFKQIGVNMRISTQVFFDGLSVCPQHYHNVFKKIGVKNRFFLR